MFRYGILGWLPDDPVPCIRGLASRLVRVSENVEIVRSY
jgi:hypothetical protein